MVWDAGGRLACDLASDAELPLKRVDAEDMRRYGTSLPQVSQLLNVFKGLVKSSI